MSTTDVQLVNRALDKLGVEPITTLSDNTLQARLANRNYDDLRKSLLRSHWWNFAIKRVTINTKTVEGSDLVEAASTTTTINATAHGLEVGDYIQFDNVSFTPKANRVATVPDADSFTLQDTLSAAPDTGTAFTTITNYPYYDFSNEFDLPSDNLRLLRLSENQRNLTYKVEGQEILANTDKLSILYVFDESNVSNMDPTFQEAFVYLMASEFAFPLIQSNTTAELMYNKYIATLKDVRSIDAMVGTPQELYADTWTDARLVGYTRRDSGSI